MNDQIKLSDQIELARWEMAFELLSMERVKPFLNDMGLSISNPDSIQSVARRFLEQIERTSNDMQKERTILQETLADIALVTDNQTAQNLYQWVMRTFSPGNQRGMFRWAWLLKWAAGVGGREDSPTLPALDREKIDAIVQIVREKFRDETDLERRLDEAELLPKSGWDAEVYKKYEAGYSPLHSVSGTIEDYRTQQMLEDIKTLLTIEEMEILLKWAKDQAPHLNITPESIKLPS